jgi:RNA-splicing ligase RtcB
MQNIKLTEKKVKVETLKEFINTSNTPEGLDQFSYDKGLLKGAKWQQERMYSEEEVLEILDEFFYDHVDAQSANTKEWFEQFKKK